MALENENLSLNEMSKNAQEEIQRTIEREKLITEIESDLRTNSKYMEFFNKYQSSSIDSFIGFYKQVKASWIQWGNMYSSIEESRTLKYSRIAYELIWQIQQKKLFNLQCQWRAEAIQLPGIETTHDFMYWELMIFNCPFLSPISEDEYDLFSEYILSDNFEIDSMLDYDWQDYDQYKDEYHNIENGITMPEWYQFYDSRTGTGSLLDLPNIRGEKEKFYLQLFFENDREKNFEKYNHSSKPDSRPPFKYYKDEVLEEFVNTFEDPKVKEFYRVIKNNKSVYVESNDDLREAIETLLQAGDIEMQYADTWQKSIIRTAKLYEVQRIYNAFSTTYKNYISRLKMGIGFDTESIESNIEITASIIKISKENILAGRVLNGEPADFNF